MNSNSEEKIYISPITLREVSVEKIWDVEKFVKEFLNLKINILAYISTNNQSKGLVEEIEKEKKNYCFQPKILKKKDEKEKDKDKENLKYILDN